MDEYFELLTFIDKNQILMFVYIFISIVMFSIVMSINQQHTKKLLLQKQKTNLIKWQAITLNYSKYNIKKNKYKVLNKYFGLHSCLKKGS